MLTSYVIKESHSKTTVRHHGMPIRLTNIQKHFKKVHRCFWQHPVLMRMWNNRNSCSLLLRMQDGAAALEGSRAASELNTHTLWPSNPTPWYSPKWVENSFPRKNLHPNVSRSFIRNCQNLEPTKMPFDGWMDKPTLALPYNGILFSAKKKWVIKPWKDMKNLKSILLSERSQSEKATYCTILPMWYSGKGKTTETVKRLVIASDRGRDKWVEHRGLSEQWNYSVW